jgi:hypothetical protein
MPVDQETVKRLAAASVVTVEDLLQKTVVELVQTGNVHEVAAKELMKAVCAATA